MVIPLQALEQHLKGYNNDHNCHQHTKSAETSAHKQRRAPSTEITRSAITRKFALPVKEVRGYGHTQICTNSEQSDTKHPARYAKLLVVITLLTLFCGRFFRLSLYYNIHKLFSVVVSNSFHLQVS